jgi:L-ascorbate metabolism protein UlaG (beta-lactamase superfamily)
MTFFMFFRLWFFLAVLTTPLWAVEGGRSDMRKSSRTETEQSGQHQEPVMPSVLKEAKSASEIPQPVTPVASPRSGEDSLAALPVLKPEQGSHLTYYGHAFVYLTSRSGVRVGINPFTEGSVGYTFPKNLAADIVLISSEASDHSGGQHFFGLPQIFRSLTGLGANRANGIPFKGVETYRDDVEGRNQGKNAVYVVEMDNIRFCHLGTLGHPLNNKQSDAIGRVDVLFLPVGSTRLSNRDLWKIVERLQAKWVIPVTYGTEKNKEMNLRPLAEFGLEGHPARELGNNQFTFTAETLPSFPSVLILKAP